MDIRSFETFKLNVSRVIADKLSYVLPYEVDGSMISDEIFRYLSLPDENGDTVAHHLVRKGHIFLPEGRGIDVLRLKGAGGRTVAHEQARKFNFLNWGKEGKEIAQIQDSNGWSVLHEQVSNGIFFDVVHNSDLLVISDKHGWTVAHEIAKQGGYISPKFLSFYGIQDDRGISVARVALTSGSRMGLEVLRYPTYWDEWGVTQVLESAFKRNPALAEKLYLLIANFQTTEAFINEAMNKIDEIFFKTEVEKKKNVVRKR